VANQGAKKKSAGPVDAGLTTLLAHLRKGAPGQLEELAADLVTRLIGVQLPVAASGFQAGGDSGTAGRGGRHLRVECKRYGDRTSLSDRELEGEIDQALRRNPALEVWVLVATRAVSETTQETLNIKARETGLPIIVLDWSIRAGALPDLAALCGWGSDCVQARYGKSAAQAASSLATDAHAVVARIQKELEPWVVGFEQIRQVTHRRLDALWNSRSEAYAAFAQDVAGGVAQHLVSRRAPSALLDEWWATLDEKPVAVYGMEGVGKTWAVMQWLVEARADLPLVLTIPSPSFREMGLPSESTVLSFLASALEELTSLRSAEFWRERLKRLLLRPLEEGAAVLLFADGVNQEPSFDWTRLLQVLQGGIFAGRVRLILTTQTHFLNEDLHGLRAGGKVAHRVGVEPYGIELGGELDQLLLGHGLQPDALSPELRQVARFPRQFHLAVKLKSSAVLEGDVTPLRLLWAHGCDDLGLREGRAFTKAAWESWMLQVAEKYWAAIQADPGLAGKRLNYTLSDIEATVVRPTQEPDWSYRRLQEIIDGSWMEAVPGRAGVFRPKESTIQLALGAAVLRLLEDAEATDVHSVTSKLHGWIDTLYATPAAPDILAAALSIAVAKGVSAASSIPAVLVASLLRSQNAQDAHRQQVVSLAPVIYPALLDVVEGATSRTNASTRHWSLLALREIHATHQTAWTYIGERIVHWVSHVVCPGVAETERDLSVQQHVSKRLISRIGVDKAGTHHIMGVPVRLHPEERSDFGEWVPGLLLGKPLAQFPKVFAAAAVVSAITVKPATWEGLKWLVSLNPVDAKEVREMLKLQSAAALALPETEGVNAELPRRVAALLLWLTGDEDCERLANTMRVSYEGGVDYERDYLPNPTRSFFAPIERRHLDLLWADNGVPLVRRLQSASRFLADPTVEVPQEFAHLMAEVASSLDVSKLDQSLWSRQEDHSLEELRPGLARIVPAELAEIYRRWFDGFASRGPEARVWAGLRATNHLVLVDGEASAAAREMRRRTGVHQNEKFVQAMLLEVELLDAGVDEQLDTLVEAADAYLINDVVRVLRVPTPSTIPMFLAKWGADHVRAMEVAFDYIAMNPHELDEETFSLLVPAVLSEPESEHRLPALIALSKSSPARLGQHLIDAEWSMQRATSVMELEHAGRAILAAKSTSNLSELRGIVPAWLLLQEARRRGGLPSDTKLVAALIGDALSVEELNPDDFAVKISISVVEGPGYLTFEPPDEDGDSDIGAVLDQNVQDRRREAAKEQGEAFLEKALSSRAIMATKLVDVADARLLVLHCTAEVELWLDGHEERTSGFCRRLNIAAGLFLAICEALLETDWRRGVSLWYAIEQCLKVDLIGQCEVRELIHIPFRVMANPGVLSIRQNLYSLARNPNDQSYMQIVLVALANGSTDWLYEQARADRGSEVSWRVKRGLLIESLLLEGDAQSPVWLEGPAIGNQDWLSRRGTHFANQQAFARHWWREFLVARDPASAYAAWHMFLHCADRRAICWMEHEAEMHQDASEFWRVKTLHMKTNKSRLFSAMKNKETKAGNSMERDLFGWSSPTDWFDEKQLAALETNLTAG